MKKKRQIIYFQIVSWVIAYVFLGVILYLFDSARTSIINQTYRIEFFTMFRVTIISGIAVGCTLGLIDILLIKLSNKNRSFRFYLIVKGILYILVFNIILGSIIFRMSEFYAEKVLEIPFGTEGFKIVNHVIGVLVLYSIIVSILISFIFEVNKKFGRGVLLRLLMGKYYNPRVEDRIFMFIDLKSSTSYAEKLGHIKYSKLIQDCFADLNSVVNLYDAEIYQYVGDEAVITWTLDKGLKNSNYLKFYFAFRERINSRSEYYKGEYGVVPEFKAGANGGHITAAEVGDIKREIAYHGDVINTAARIQEVCNQYQRKFLISEFLAEKIKSASEYLSEEIDSIKFKGKENPVRIYGIELHS